jgi:hypothetical protein
MAIAVKEEVAEAAHGRGGMASVELNDRLDNLWSHYLQQLETYQTAQTVLQDQLSAAFFSLAQANFSKASGRRYGRDYYDQRAVASVRVHVKQSTTGNTEHDEPSPSAELTIVEKQASGRDTNELSKTLETLIIDEDLASTLVEGNDVSRPNDEDQHTSTATFPTLLNNGTEAGRAEQSRHREKSNVHTSPPDAPQDDRTTEQDPTDPLRSFAGGILIPPQLRRTRDAFASIFQTSNAPAGGSTDCSIVQAMVAARRMREIEADIRRIRKAIRKAEKDPGEK